MTEDKIADWHAQFAPLPAPADVQPVDEASRLPTVEHFADADGVFTAPEPKAEPVEPEARRRRRRPDESRPAAQVSTRTASPTSSGRLPS